MPGLLQLVAEGLPAANLIGLALVAWRAGIVFGRLSTTQGQHTLSLTEIKTTLGNGGPGTVVKTPVCERMHASVGLQIAAVAGEVHELHEDVREIREVVINLKGGAP